MEIVLEHGLASIERHDLDAGELLADQPMRTWRRYSQAIFAAKVKPLLHLLHDGRPDQDGDDLTIAPEDVDWDEVAHEVVARLVERLPDASSPVGALSRTLVVVFGYFESLVFWENSMVYEQISGLVQAIDAVDRALAAQAGTDRTSTLAARVSRATIRLANTLEAQFAVEDSIGCCSALALHAASERSHAGLRAVAQELHDLWDELDTDADPTTDPLHQRVLRALVALLLDDLAQTGPYHERLHADVAPATIAFLDYLKDRRPAAETELTLLLQGAIDRCREFEESPAGQRSVSATELRAHRLSLEEALACIERDQAVVRFDEAEVTYVIPFGLPVEATGDDPVRRVLRAHLVGSAQPQVDRIPALGGVSWTLDDTPQTDAWLDGSSAGIDDDDTNRTDNNDLDYLGVRLQPTAHELVLQTVDGTFVRGLNLEIRLGALGNHYVRVVVGTEMLVSTDGGATWSGDPIPWTPHEVDQFIRRGGADMGAEAIWMEAKSTLAAAAPPEPPSNAATDLITFASRLVTDLDAYAATISNNETVSRWPPNEIKSFLRRHSQVLLTVPRASLVTSTAATPIEHTERMAEVVGTQVAMTAQRPYAQSVLEWLRYPPPSATDIQTKLLDGRIRRELLWCSGDTTSIFAASLPNWQLMETRELIEFAASLTGVYARRHNWLQRTLSEANTANREAPGSDANVHVAPNEPSNQLDTLTTARLREELAEAQQVEQRLNERLSHVQVMLDRALDFRVSRDQQSRDVLRHICSHNGVTDLQDALASSVAAASTQQRLVRARVERLQGLLNERLLEEQEQRRRRAEKPVQMLVGVLAVFSFIDLFWWFNDSWTLNGNHWFWGAEFTILFLLAIAVGRRTLRIWRSEDDGAPTSTEPSSGSAALADAQRSNEDSSGAMAAKSPSAIGSTPPAAP